MKSLRALFLLAPALLLAVPAAAQDLTSTLVGSDGEPKGSATVVPAMDGVNVTLDLAGLPEGWHAVHFHERASCDVAKQFSTAGDHVNLDRDTHGIMAGGGPHAGDLPNIWIHADGTGKAEFFTPFITTASILDANGTAIMIHAAADDHRTQPSGASGDRIACGPIIKK